MTARLELAVADPGDAVLAVAALRARAEQLRSAGIKAAAEVERERRAGTDVRTAGVRILSVLADAGRLDDVATSLELAVVVVEEETSAAADPEAAPAPLDDDELPVDPAARATLLALRAAQEKAGRPADPDAPIPESVADLLGLDAD